MGAEAFDFFDGETQGIVHVKVVEFFVEVFFGAVGFFDFECVESFGVNDAFDFAAVIDNWKIGEAGFV